MVIGSSVRKPAVIVAAWLQSLAWQIAPRNVQRFYLFVDDGCEPDARALLDKFVLDYGGQVWDAPTPPVQDFSDVGSTHAWSETAMARVGAHKDRILDFARVNRADAVWLVDADLICDPMTLTSVWSVPEAIVCAVYWTSWMDVPPEHPPVHSGPQVWLTQPYGLAGNGMEEWEFRRRLIDRQVTQVFGQGACSLLRRSALERGVCFAKWPANNHPGIGQGEDRHLCLRAEALHIRMVADPYPDIFHIYHRPSDEKLIPEMLDRLGKVATGTPRLGDLISLDLHALEPVPFNTGWAYAPAQQVRGRLGKVALHPELESAVLTMERGEVRVIPVHFGLDYPFPPYRGQRRLIRLTLIDHKPFGFPPVIEQEVIQNEIGSWMDTTTLTDELVEQVKEIHAA